MNNSIERTDLFLAFFFAPTVSSENNVPIKGRTKLEKAFFIFEKEIKKNFFNGKSAKVPFYEFNPYNYGPYSDKVIEDLNFFLSIGFIEESETDIPIPDASKVEGKQSKPDAYAVDTDCDDKFEISYLLSEKGERYTAENVWVKLSTNQKDALIELKTRITELSLDTILRYVYNKYPEMTSKSKIADKYLT